MRKLENGDWVTKKELVRYIVDNVPCSCCGEDMTKEDAIDALKDLVARSVVITKRCAKGKMYKYNFDYEPANDVLLDLADTAKMN